MISKTPTRKGRTLAMAAAVALAGGAAITPALTAHAAGTLPTSLTKNDASGYVDDAFQLPVVDGYTWTYKVGSGTAKTVPAFTSTATLYPYVGLTSAPSGGDLTVTVTASDGTNDTNFSLTFTPDVASTPPATGSTDKFIAPKPPTIKVNKTGETSTFSDVIIPKVTGVTYTAKQYTDVNADGDESAVATIPTDGKTPIALAATTKSVKVTATAGTGFTLTSTKALVSTDWVFNVKAAKNKITAPTTALLRSVDNPGVKDWVEVTGVEGVQLVVGAKKINAKPGQTIKVPRAKGAANVEFTATPQTGYQFGDGTTASVTLTSATFTDTTASDVKPTTVGKSVTVPADVAVKSWQFTGSDNKVLKFAVPKGMSSVTVVVPGAGTVEAVPVAGYSFSGGTTAKTGKWTVS